MVPVLRRLGPEERSRIEDLLLGSLGVAGLEWAYHLDAAGEGVEAHCAEDFRDCMLVLRAADVLIVTSSRAVLEQFLNNLDRGKSYAFRCQEWMAPTILARFPPRQPAGGGVVLLTYATDERAFAKCPDTKCAVHILTEEDADAVVAYSGLHWSPELIRKRINDGSFYGIREDGNLISWVGTLWETDRACEIGFAHTKEGCRGRGLMKVLTSTITERVLQREKIPILHTVEANLPARKVAEGLGFSVKAREWAYFSSPEAVPSGEP